VLGLDTAVKVAGLADPRKRDFVVNGLLYELRRRGIVRPGYDGASPRENLGMRLPPLSAAVPV
jgi:hypothetical protein